MGRNKGVCTLCGKGRKLTFEHVPAEASGNQRDVVMFNLEEWLARDPRTWQMSGGTRQPEGMGLEALCEECNVKLLGTHYVPSFVDFVEAGKQMLTSVAGDLAEYDARERETILDVGFNEVDRLAVAKQIVSMILVTSGRKVVESNPALADFVQEPKSRGIPPLYRLFLALNPGPAAKVTGVTLRVDTVTGRHTVAAEVVYPPFAYSLSFNGTAVYSAGEITPWIQAEYGSVVQEPLRLPLGFCYTAFPGDLRTKAQIDRQAKEERDGGSARSGDG